MRTKTILILQGGGALGAYECGVYQALAPHLDELAVVAGTSIGAVNASLIAKHNKDPDHGAAALTRFWTEELATASQPFVPPVVADWQRWNAIWTNLLWGTRHLSTLNLVGFPWVFRAPFWWELETHFYNMHALEQTLHRHFESYGPKEANPRLIVTAVDIEAGTSRSFDSYTERITAEHVVACGSLPPTFPPKEIDGKYYWDGGLWSNTPLPEVLNALQQIGPIYEKYHVYIIDVFPRKGRVPQNNWEVWSRISELTYADKTGYDRKASEWLNQYIDLVKKFYGQRSTLPPAIREDIEERYHVLINKDKRIQLDFTIILRSAYPDEDAEYISREIDFSPDRIEELIRQGRRDAEDQLERDRNGPDDELRTREPSIEAAGDDAVRVTRHDVAETIQVAIGLPGKSPAIYLGLQPGLSTAYWRTKITPLRFLEIVLPLRDVTLGAPCIVLSRTTRVAKSEPLASVYDRLKPNYADVTFVRVETKQESVYLWERQPQQKDEKGVDFVAVMVQTPDVETIDSLYRQSSASGEVLPDEVKDEVARQLSSHTHP